MTEPNRQSGENEERIIEIEIERLRPFKEHPFQVKDVLYRVTPVFEGSNLVASGVLMEAESVEDKGEGILYCVYVYNVQPGININYATGDSSASGTNKTAETEQARPHRLLRRQLLSRPARNPISSIPIQRNFIGRPVHRSNR